MNDMVEFLRNAAARLRALASAAPEIGQDLRVLADDLEEEADDVARRSQQPRQD
jgi:peptide deformylase